MSSCAENNSLFKQPSALIPLAMSLAALVFVLGFVAVFGHGYHSDERASARIFQLVMAAQLPISAYFVIKWLPRRPKQSLLVVALQAVAWLIPIVTVIWLESL